MLTLPDAIISLLNPLIRVWGITNRGKRWYKGGLHYLITNKAYTGTAGRIMT